MRAADQFHVGIVVDDLDAALDTLGALFGYAWCSEISVETPVVFPEGESMVPFRFRYSASLPRIEVIQSMPGTPWVPAAGSGVHHLGYWTNDLAADAAALSGRGYAEEARGVDPDGSLMWGYFRPPDGPRIELVSRELQPGLELYWTSG